MEKKGDGSRRVQQFQLLDLPEIMNPGHVEIVLEELILKIA